MAEYYQSKQNKFYAEDLEYIDYKDFKTLQRYVNVYGQIETRKKTGLTESQQRRLSVAIKRARHIALMPFVANN